MRYSDPFSAPCVLLTSSNPGNRRFGTGFVVCHLEHTSYIVTCAHVITDIGGPSLIEVDGKSAKVIASGADDGLDLAVIETDRSLNQPIVNLGLRGGVGTPFFTSGFRAFGRHFSISSMNGRVIAPVALKSRTHTGRVKAWSLSIEKGEYLHEGHSGSPVIDEESGVCFGVITYKQGEGQIGLAVSIEELEHIWATMPLGLIDKTTEPQSYHQTLFDKATRLHLMGDLGEALHIYQRIKAAEPSFPRIDMMIRSIEEEMKRGARYLDRQGQRLYRL